MLVGFIEVGLVAHLLLEWDARRKRQRVFGARPSVPPHDVFDGCYARSGVDRAQFLSLWNECARILEVPPDVVRPADRFNVEFAPAGFFDELGHHLMI